MPTERSKRRVAFILNPNAGCGKAATQFESLVPFIRTTFSNCSIGDSWIVLRTTKVGDARKLTRKVIAEGSTSLFIAQLQALTQD